MDTLKFYYNGIKAFSGVIGNKPYLQPVRYAVTTAAGKYPAGTVHITAKTYASFSIEIYEKLKVQNNTDPVTSYFEKDHIHVPLDHPLYNQVLAAALKAEAISNVKKDKFSERFNARRASESSTNQHTEQK